jgi:ArsR family transcriptional regulator
MSTQAETSFPSSVYLSAVEDASLLAAAADPNRMTILKLLSDGTTCVCTIKEHVRLAPNLLSYHLKVLRDARLVVSKRRGRWVDYRLVEGALGRLREAIPVARDDESPQKISRRRRNR